MADINVAGGDWLETSDELLLAKIADGNRRAFQLLASRHGPRLLRLAWRYSGNATHAEDIVQEALVRIWQRASQWDGARGSGKSWIDRIVINLCFDERRRLVPSAGLEEIADRPDIAPDPHGQLTGRQLGVAIAAAIEGLPDRQRAALALCYNSETSCAEGARILGISVPTMESLLQRGRRSVRRQLVERGLINAK